MQAPHELDESCIWSYMSLIERFVVLMYDRTSDALQVNEARKRLFTTKCRALENIPSTKAVLEQHLKRAFYQAYIWNHALKPSRTAVKSCWLGWAMGERNCQPVWTTLPEASEICCELIHCRCVKGCSGRCKCKKAALKCTALCACSGDCRLKQVSSN